MIETLKKISSFRAGREFFLLLREPDPAEVFSLIFRMKINKFIVPGVTETCVVNLRKAQEIWLDFFIYLHGKADESFFYYLALLKDASPRAKKKLTGFFALPDRRKNEVMFSGRKLNLIIKRIEENHPEWPFMLDVLSPEMTLSLALENGDGTFKKKIMDYILRLRLKKSFHSSGELMRMGFTGREIGMAHRTATRERRRGKITSKMQEYDFLVRKLKKI